MEPRQTPPVAKLTQALLAHREEPPTQPSGRMKVSSLRVKVLEGATAAALESAVHSYVAGRGEEWFLSVTFGKPDGGNYWAAIAYVE